MRNSIKLSSSKMSPRQILHVIRQLASSTRKKRQRKKRVRHVRNYCRRIEEKKSWHLASVDAAGVHRFARDRHPGGHHQRDLDRSVPNELSRAGGAVLHCRFPTPASTSAPAPTQIRAAASGQDGRVTQ